MPRTVKLPSGVLATETRMGRWEWEVEGVTWRYTPGPGLNLGIVHEDGSVQPMFLIDALRDLNPFIQADIFSHGFAAGLNATKQYAA